MAKKTWRKKDAPEVVITFTVAGQIVQVWKSLAWSQKDIDQAKKEIDEAVMNGVLWKD